MLITWYIHPDLSHRIGWFLGDNKPNMIMGHCENCPCKQNANKFAFWRNISRGTIHCHKQNWLSFSYVFHLVKSQGVRDASIFPFLARCAPTFPLPPHHYHSSIYSITCYEINYFVIAWVETQFFMVVTYFLESLVVFLLCMIICISLWVLSLRRGDRRDRTTQWCLYDSHEFWWDNINSRDITPQTPTAMYNKLLIWYHSVCGLSHVGLRMLKIGNGKHLSRTQAQVLVWYLRWLRGLKTKVHQRTSFLGYFSWQKEQ